MRDFMAFGGEKHPGGRTQVFVQDHASAKVTDVNGAQFSGPSPEPEVSEGSDHLGIVFDGISAKCQQSLLSFRSSAEQPVESQADLNICAPRRTDSASGDRDRGRSVGTSFCWRIMSATSSSRGIRASRSWAIWGCCE